jgi:uncharacterized membrane protein YgdD (TMEM256/DUF423 family)
MKAFLILGSLSAMLAVVFGAFGAHILKSRLSEEMLNHWQTAVHYHFWQALGLLLLGLAGYFISGKSFLTSGYLIFSGMLLFSGSLYLLSLFNLRWLGMITPFGGLAMILGWAFFAWAVFRS